MRHDQEGCLVAAVTIDAATFSARLAKAANEAFASWIDELARGLVRFGTDPASAPELAATIIAQLEGALLLARASRGGAAIDFARRAVKHLVQAAGGQGRRQGPRRRG
jgi:TetR/AcrR family transcriptional repressor of lmrAB and yxaGH operons